MFQTTAGLFVTLLIIVTISHTLGNQWPAECEGKSYCHVKPPHYPQKEIDDHFSDPRFESVIKIRNGHYDEAELLQQDDKEGDNCKTITYTNNNKLYMIKTNASFLYVVQSKFFGQRIQVTDCLKPNKDCFEDFQLQTQGKRATCQTRTTSRDLFVYDKDTKKVEHRPMQIPVCCVCSINGDNYYSSFN